MAGLIREIIQKWLLSVSLTSVLSVFFDELLRIGESPFQSLVVLSFYTYCSITLFSSSAHKLFHVISIPIITQFLHLFQKYTFTAGANSIWRLLPFLLLVFYFLYFFIRKNPKLSQSENLFLVSWIIGNFCYFLISPNLHKIVIGGFLLYLITLPMYFLYFTHAMHDADFCAKIEGYLSLLFTMLGLGTFGLVIAAADYKGSDNLLATRNITDTNVTMAYFILLWPFTLLYCRQRIASFPATLFMLFIFLGVVVFSFSRGAVFIIIPYLIVTLLLIRGQKQIWWLIFAVVVALVFIPELANFTDRQDLAYFWRLRFGDFQNISAAIEKLQTASGRAEIHAIAYGLFLQSPLFGHGIGSFETLGPGYREAHSIFFTLLAEQGIIGIVYMYSIFLSLGFSLIKISCINVKYALLPISLTFYLLFNHTVGTVFVIIPGKSVTINCIAPMLLLCHYFYAKSKVLERTANDA
ncbi:O-antigen ligase family protein [Dyadobacter arcticus]|uniref:O-antigen ligase n=1 Tax=Dyadobacter arcticus TaxID=1078754 RepID=A0ABX0UQR5_9BACT|nr:O-antigen ligase family protein [Dyadobacter arcticus]NIJ55338.1 O-antigen ligase [Dyadobacter arcticus]